MKIHIEIDCTPDEARAFLGLPDVAPVQAAVMADIQQRMLDSLKAMEPDALFKTWLPAGLKGWEDMQKQFWSQMTAAAGGKSGAGKDKG